MSPVFVSSAPAGVPTWWIIQAGQWRLRWCWRCRWQSRPRSLTPQSCLQVLSVWNAEQVLSGLLSVELVDVSAAKPAVDPKKVSCISRRGLQSDGFWNFGILMLEGRLKGNVHWITFSQFENLPRWWFWFLLLQILQLGQRFHLSFFAVGENEKFSSILK